MPVGAEPGGPGLPEALADALEPGGRLMLPVLLPDLDLDWAEYHGPYTPTPGPHGPTRLAELTRTARPLLLDSTGSYAEVSAPWRDRVDVVTGPLQGTTATALLVRPDCFVAWSAGDGRDAATLRDSLTHHFGLPS